MKIRQQEGGCMKKFIENIIIIMVLTVAILFSYAVMEKKISGKSSSEFINFLFNTQEKAFDNKNTDKDSIEDPIKKGRKQSDTMDYKAIWLSYLEFNSYRKSVKNNNEKNFRKFYKYILQRINFLDLTALSYKYVLLGMHFMNHSIFHGQLAFLESKGKIQNMIL